MFSLNNTWKLRKIINRKSNCTGEPILPPQSPIGSVNNTHQWYLNGMKRRLKQIWWQALHEAGVHWCRRSLECFSLTSLGSLWSTMMASSSSWRCEIQHRNTDYAASCYASFTRHSFRFHSIRCQRHPLSMSRADWILAARAHHVYLTWLPVEHVWDSIGHHV